MSKYESPKYEVMVKEEEFEIRKYFNFFIVEYANTDDSEMSDGFMSLFKYISSENEEQQKIPMTVPVISQIQNNQKTMAFVMPAKFNNQIPKPNHPNIHIKKIEEGIFGTIRYSGRSQKNKQAHMKEKLHEWLLEKGYQIDSDYIKASYDGPFVLPMMRRNEIWVRIT